MINQQRENYIMEMYSKGLVCIANHFSSFYGDIMRYDQSRVGYRSKPITYLFGYTMLYWDFHGML